MTAQARAKATPSSGAPYGRSRYRNVPYYAILILWSAVTISIFAWLVLSSFKTNREVFGSPWSLPATPWAAAIANYTKAWQIAHMNVYFVNSVIVTAASVVLLVLICAPAAYALSRVEFPGRELVNSYLVAGMGLPVPLILIPVYVLLANLRLANSLQGLITVYVAVSIPFTVLLLTGFFRTLPSELEDAAAIDGCSESQIFWRIMMPLAGPGLFTAAIFNFVAMWNEFLLALLIINNDSLRTMPIGVYNIRYTMQYTADWAGLFAAVVLVIIPSFIVYVLLSERIMAGLTLGSNR
ncbi:MAG TPA: carbohydrate ABC transporter permease [Anaerolineae bacterium]|nr:carbohydrate ABC transporter permease [Anaerolineae bacterium]HOQ97787.1 carbohydrate ABC transporter permease [Anaerolineae bacterium]HPL27217.1 carbohydrate ABC transporter permease [Anaerolineae bacterium]